MANVSAGRYNSGAQKSAQPKLGGQANKQEHVIALTVIVG